MLGLLELVVWFRLQPPPVAPLGAPQESFSAARAERALERLLRSERPHPSGTPELAAVRERLLVELAELGLAPELQRGVACNDMFGVCAELVNVLAVVPGKSERVRLALLAHYDSVPAGPGAGDDGQGTATLLEVARALRAQPADESVALVLTDGEELGLLGARLFVREHPLSGELTTVINVEARGTRGPSLMFETSPGSAWLVELYARAALHPVTSSVFPAVYRTLPNDTDFSIFAQRGVQGLNFAFIGGVENYHTPGDRSGNVDFRSVQQQGSTVLGLVREITAHGPQPPGAEAIFFDVLALGVVRLRVSWMWVLAALASAALLISVVRTVRDDARHGKALVRATAAVLFALALPGLGAWLVAQLVGALGALPFVFVAHPEPLLASFLLFAAAAHAVLQSRALSSEARLALWDATWIVWSLLGWLLLALVPGASYICWVPAAAAALSRLALGQGVIGAAGARLGQTLLLTAPAIVVTLLVWLPLASMLYGAIGFAVPPALAIVFTLPLGPVSFLLAPLFGTTRRALVLSGVGVLAGLAQCLPAPYSASVPQRLSLALSADAEGRAEWIADTTFGPLPASLAGSAPWGLESSELFPLPAFGRPRVQRVAADASARPEIQPVLRHVGLGELELELELPAAAWAATLHLRGSRTLVRASFRAQSVRARPEGQWQALTVVPGADRRIVLSLTFPGSEPPEMAVSEVWLGLPPAAAPLVSARGASALPSQLGDLTLRWVRVAAPSVSAGSLRER